MMFSAVLKDDFQDGDNGIPTRYRFDWKLFNLKRMQAKCKVQTEVLDKLLFADDMAKVAPAEEKMQQGVAKVFDSCGSYDITISIKKTKMCISAITWKALQGAYHHSDRSRIASGRQVHLPWKHIVKHSAH